jgi:hypothetical protein
MSATTVFKDKLGAGVNFPLRRDVLAKHFDAEVVAVYFISTATWVRQAAPLDGPRLPVLRLQRHRVGRVGRAKPFAQRRAAQDGKVTYRAFAACVLAEKPTNEGGLAISRLVLLQR